MDLRNLIERHLDLARLSADLDEIGHFARVWSVRQWTRSDMATLWEASKGFRGITLNDFVPPSIPPLVEVIHDGKNSLPAYTEFQKRFCRPKGASLRARLRARLRPEERPADGPEEWLDGEAGEEGTLIGYNHQSFSPLTGPGYFVVHPSTEIGEVDIDHAMLPDEKPEQWPDIVGNDAGLRRLVYDSQVDVVRGLSTHVSIGRAKRRGRWRDTWFVLVRQDLTAAP